MDPSRLCRSIEQWFACRDGDGEFAQHKRTDAYVVVAPARSEASWLFTTKPACVMGAIGEGTVRDRFAMIGGYGLPRDNDLSWISRLVGAGRLSFLGDLDPVDLLIYRWLRDQFVLLEMAYLGIGDVLLGISPFEATDLPRIPLSPSEQEALPLLEQCFPDLAGTIGIQSAELLRLGWKLELEAWVGGGAASLANLLLDGG
ncbi:MAG TPA: hypothetical protein VG826_19150 [Pirellulales bacterium]|nr:hypothetical protein [Pirellulales bacterium]